MKIRVYGKAHLEGHSKRTGKDYNFNQIHTLAQANGVEGYAAEVITLDPVKFPIGSITVGADYNIEFDKRGFVVAFDPVK